MKTLVWLIIFMFVMLPVVEASWYVVNKSGKVIAKCEYEPSISDLDSRGEIAILCEEDIELSQAEYKNDKIKKHKKTPQELSEETRKEETAIEEDYIREEMRKMAIERLEQAGHKFKHANKDEKRIILTQ